MRDKRQSDTKTACEGKKRFASYSGAEHSMQMTIRHRPERDSGAGHHLRVYHCPHCRGFHVGGEQR